MIKDDNKVRCFECEKKDLYIKKLEKYISAGMKEKHCIYEHQKDRPCEYKVMV